MSDPGSADTPRERAQEAFARAVHRELQAIETHQRAVAMHESAAGQAEQLAAMETGEVRQAALLERAAEEHRRADAARQRAADARARLRSEGVDPDAPEVPRVAENSPAHQ